MKGDIYVERIVELARIYYERGAWSVSQRLRASRCGERRADRGDLRPEPAPRHSACRQGRASFELRCHTTVSEKVIESGSSCI